MHAMNQAFKDPDSEVVLLVDANNAFNSLNRQVALRNITAICPSMATVLINTYRRVAELYVDGTTLHSQESTTQGDPLAMPMYELALLPLIKNVNSDLSATQVWYADDATTASNITNLHVRWDALVTLGPKFGYHVNPSKTHLITKDGHHQRHPRFSITPK